MLAAQWPEECGVSVLLHKIPTDTTAAFFHPEITGPHLERQGVDLVLPEMSASRSRSRGALVIPTKGLWEHSRQFRREEEI